MNGGGLGIAHLADIEPIGASKDFFAATDLKLDRRVAVRIFDRLVGGAHRVRFDHDSKVLGSLSSHPNVVTIYDAGFTDEEKPFLLMELIDGQDLDGYLASRGVLGWRDAANLALQICAGLEQAHRSGALHRDLRPSNILMAGNTPKLTEFGITRSGPEEVPNDPALLQHWAPETFDGVWDERTDLYSLTSTLYQLIDGTPPFWRPGQDTAEMLRHRLVNEQAPGLEPDVAPAALDQFLVAGLAKDPMDRPQTADEFAHELRLITEGRTTGSVPSVLHGSGSAGSTTAMSTQLPPPVAAPAAPMAFGTGSVPVVTAATVPSQLAMSTTISEGPPPGLTPPNLTPRSSPTAASAPNIASAEWAPARPSEQPAWAAPAPSSAPSPEVDGTAMYPDFASQTGAQAYDPSAAASGGYVPQSAAGQAPPLIPDTGLLDDDSVSPRRSPIFTAAVAMIAVGVLGLAAVLAISSLGSDDTQSAAPALPDPNQPVTVDADTGETVPVDPAAAVEDSDDGQGEAMEDGSADTTVAPEQSSTTETTVQRFQVPNLVGMEVEAASKLLTDADFQVLVVGRRSVNTAPGTVFQQTPAAGQQVTLPLTVTLYIPKVSNLPEMVGRSADTVCLELEALGLTCDRQPTYNDQVATGSIIATDPIGGSLFSEGTSVKVSVSLGPVPTIAIPDVAGRTEAEADTILMEAGFTVLVKPSRASTEVEMGRVIGTDPVTGAALAVDRPLTVLISSGASTSAATVPNVVGMSAADAEAMLTGAGLTVTMATMDLPEGDPGIGVVVSTDPAAGTEVAAGSAVTITVGQQAPAENNSEESSG